MKGKMVSFLVGMLVFGSSMGFVSGVILPGKTTVCLAGGHIFYVGGAGPGNFSKIQDAIDNASPGDTVFVYDDSSPYKENVTISKPIILQGEQKETTIVDGSHRIGMSFHVVADNVTITGFTIQNTGTAVYIGGVGGTASHNTIKDNIILNSHAGIVMYYGDPMKPEFLPYGYNIISHNYIKNSTFYGITVNEGRNNLITGNTVTETHGLDDGSYGFGIEVSGAFNNISYNNISNNDRFGIIIGDTYKTEIYRNIIEKNGLYGLAIECGSFDRVIQNNFIGNHRQAAFDQQIKILSLVLLGHYPILPCLWKGNYWNRPRQLPYIVRGNLGYTGIFSWSVWSKFNIIPTNFVRFDLSPAQTPYDISLIEPSHAQGERVTPAPAFVPSKPLPAPKFEVTFEGPGTFLVKNVGDANATNVKVRQQLQGGLIILGKDKTVTIPSIAVGDTKEAHLGTICGFGRTTITFSITCDEGVNQSSTSTAFILLFFIIGIK